MRPLLDSVVPTAKDFVMKRPQMQQIIKDNLCKAQERMKHYDDSHRSEREFWVGDLTYLKLQAYRQSSILCEKIWSSAPNTMLYTRFWLRLNLELPSISRVHLVFHVSLLKNKIGAKKVVQSTLPSSGDDGIVFD